MISARRNFIFVHIPKTGGNSLSRLLIDYSDDELVKTEPYHDLHDRFNVRGIVTGRKHFTAADYVERIGLERFVTFRKFAFVRNPYGRAMSHYFSPYRWIQEVDGRLVPEPFRFDRAAFYAFIRTMAPMTSFLSYDGKLLAFDRIGRFENFEADARELLRLCGVTIPPAAPLPFLNRGYAEKLQHYDAETAAWVRERFRDDFSAFDYDPDAVPTAP
jgi:hypothetical protein